MQLSQETKAIIEAIYALKDAEYKENTENGIKNFVSQTKKILETLKVQG